MTIIIIVCGLDVAVRLVITFLEARVGEGRLGRLIFGRVFNRIANTTQDTIADVTLEGGLTVAAQENSADTQSEQVSIGQMIPGSPNEWLPSVSEYPIVKFANNKTFRGPTIMIKPSKKSQVNTIQIPPENTPFATVALDLAGPFPITARKNKYILNIMCCWTKYAISVPMPDATAATISRAFLNECYLKFGGCTNLLTDNATAFTSEFFKSFCSGLHIKKCNALPHWSQENAIVERSFRTFHNNSKIFK